MLIKQSYCRNGRKTLPQSIEHADGRSLVAGAGSPAALSQKPLVWWHELKLQEKLKTEMYHILVSSALFQALSTRLSTRFNLQHPTLTRSTMRTVPNAPTRHSRGWSGDAKGPVHIFVDVICSMSTYGWSAHGSGSCVRELFVPLFAPAACLGGLGKPILMWGMLQPP